MRLHSLLPALDRQPVFGRLVDALRRPGAIRETLSVITPARPYALAALHAALDRPLLLVVGRPSEARVYANELRAWAADPEAVLLFPETDALPYDRLPNDSDKLAERLSTLERLSGLGHGGTASKPLVVASVRAAMDLVLDPQAFRDNHRLIKRGQVLPPAELATQWLGLGYESAALVDQPGLFSRRGGILDVYPPGGQPLRIELWGNEIDTIRLFDPATQRSTDQLESAAIGPAHEVLPRPLSVSLLLDRVRPQFLDAFARDLRFLHEGSQAFSALEFYRGFLGSATLADYLPADGLLLLDEPEAVARYAEEFEEQVEQLHADLLDRGEVPPGLARPYRPWREAMRARATMPRLDIKLDPDLESLPFEHAPKFGGRLDAFMTQLVARQPQQTAVVLSQQASRLSELLHEQGVSATPHEVLPPRPAAVELVHGLLREGWVSDALDVSVFTDSEIFGWTKQRRSAPLRRVVAERAAAARDTFIADLQPGDLVVHIDHGIGRYGGLVRTPVGSVPGQETSLELPGHAEFLLLHYAEGDNLYVPVSQADRVGRYIGAGDADPSLTRLGSGEWVRAKAKVRRSVRDLAQELMELYGARSALEGHAYPVDTPWQFELEGSFAYEETPDQVQAILDVKTDMESPRPMDRLLVGDVGFGKTEVALRAAFKAVQDGRQVAVLVPTTVLAQQHYNTFRERLGAFPVKVQMLSRFRSDKEQREIIAGLSAGSVDICIGTHRLVQRDVEFKNLGLVVIDEEQRFGVAHKERLKQLRREVDVLTLTATPIPRTLHMGLVGVRDMSLLETAPEARLPVRTYVTEYDDGMVQEAILREIDRGGQVYFVNNRVQGIETIANRLRRLVPDARVAVAHGQMPEDLLEQTMLGFAEGDYDVLVCTTIIESGLDIPNANTLVVNSAHRFGLAQLYQLRGRVGRSTSRAYAYLLYAKDMALSEIAQERLKTIFEATELGAGMRIAMKDLEIRGAGNLLGSAQSGHIAAVGFDLYTKLLAEQVDLLKARQDGSGRLPIERAWPSIDVPLNAFIPPEYVLDDAVRLRLYQRFSAIEDDQQLASLVAELEDRFGSLPEAAQHLVYMTSLRLRAIDAAVQAVTATHDEIIVKFDRLPSLNPDQLARKVGVALKRGSNQLRFVRGQGLGWMERLYGLVSALPQASTEVTAPELPMQMTPCCARREILPVSVNQIMYHGPGGGRGGRGRRLGSAAAARVGLTDGTNGTATPAPEPPPDAPGFTLTALWANAGTTWHGFRRVLALVWEANPGLTLALAVLNLAQGGLPAARVWVSKLLVDAVVAAVTTGNGTAALPQVVFLVALQFVIGAAGNILSTIGNICQQLLQEQVANRIQMLVMRQANALDLVFFERPQFYDLLQQVQREATFRPVQMVQTAFGLIRQVLTFASLLALLVNLEWFIAVAALLSPIPAFVSSARYGWQGYQMMRWQSPLRRMMSYLTNLMTSDTYNKEVKLFTVGNFFIERFSNLFQRYYAENRSLVIRRYLAGAVWSMLTVLTSGLTFLYVAFRTLGGTISVGGLTLYVQAADGVSQAFSALLGGLQSMYEHQLYLKTLFELLDFEPQVRAPESPVPLRHPIEEGIEFRNVTYTYEGKDEPALNNVSFKIARGETVAIVGHNGAGKTTLVKLVARLYDPQEGQVLIDGRDVREYDPDELRGEFGVLFQDYVSYQFSARENIGIGRVERLDDTLAIASAANKSGASSVIEKLPQGYDTVLGKWFDGGVNLSGGEWQKVALGRAFMREAQILILDEPSAALDARAEFELFTRLRELAHGRTAIFISHRFSTVRQADRILVFEQGSLIESGTHEELLALGGRYAELFNLQAASYR